VGGGHRKVGQRGAGVTVDRSLRERRNAVRDAPLDEVLDARRCARLGDHLSEAGDIGATIWSAGAAGGNYGSGGVSVQLGPLGRGRELVGMGGFRRLQPKVDQFFRDPRTRRIFSFQAMYAGLAPHDALAIYAVIAYLDLVAGVFSTSGALHAAP